MIRILNGVQMSLCDSLAREKYGISELALMERAALLCVNELTDSDLFELSSVLIICGTGNNGADGLAIGRILLEKGIKADVYIAGDKSRGTESFKRQYNSYTLLGGMVLDSFPSKQYKTGVDAIFGINLNREIEGIYAECVSYLNEKCSKVLSVDMPSGIHPKSGKVLGVSVKADVTITFQFLKTGLVLYPGHEYAGRVEVKNIGIPNCTIDEIEDSTYVFALSDDEIALPKRQDYSNKGTYGKLLLIAGSEEISGAAILCALSAMRSGLGMIKVVTSDENKAAFSQILPEAMLITYKGNLVPDSEIIKAFDWADAVAIGPGIGLGHVAEHLVELVLKSNKPCVFDADALNILSETVIKNTPSLLKEHGQDIIITPHVGEMARLTELRVKDITSNIIETAADFSENYNVITVLKDAVTVISDNKNRVCLNLHGNNGMATAGSGDVLTGIVAAILAYKKDAFYSAYLGCALHARSGDEALRDLSYHELLARDIIKYLDR